MENQTATRTATILVILATGAWLMQWFWALATRFSDIILLFVLGWLLAFVLGPLCKWVEHMGASRRSAVTFVYLGMVVALAGGIGIGSPILLDQTIQLSNSLPSLGNDLQQRTSTVRTLLIAQGVGPDAIGDVSRAVISRAESVVTVIVGNALAVATAVLDTIARTLLILLFSFYISLDSHQIGTAVRHLAPSRFRHDVESAMQQIDRTFGGFVRSLLVQAILYGFGNAVVMVIGGLPFVLVISVVATIAMLVPVIGPIIATVPPLIISFLAVPDSLWWTALALLGLQVGVANVLATRLMSRSVGVHPLVVFGAVLVGARIGGAWGGILGVPVAAILVIFARVVFVRVVRKTTLFQSGTFVSVAIPADNPAPDPT